MRRTRPRQPRPLQVVQFLVLLGLRGGSASGSGSVWPRRRLGLGGPRRPSGARRPQGPSGSGSAGAAGSPDTRPCSAIGLELERQPRDQPVQAAHQTGGQRGNRPDELSVQHLARRQPRDHLELRRPRGAAVPSMTPPLNWNKSSSRGVKSLRALAAAAGSPWTNANAVGPSSSGLAAPPRRPCRRRARSVSS